MPPNPRTTAETYFADIRRVRASGGATEERSSYGPLSMLLNSVGGLLKPKVFCVGELTDQGAGHPDFGLYASNQVQKGRPRPGQTPERGVVEVKGVEEEVWLTAESNQVRRYLERYQLVVVTNTRDFVLVGTDAAGRPARLETFHLARDAEDFARRLETPRTFARQVGSGLVEYLTRALSHRAALAEPKDLAWLLASYARDGLARIESAGNTTALVTVREALEESLGVQFKGEKGERFFHSTLVQTLFYGLFSAWVLWSRVENTISRPLLEVAESTARFRWREAVWHLRVPVLQALFQQLTQPGRLQPLGLVEVLDWTEAALNRVNRNLFFGRFAEGEAVPYFYEPFLAEFDPKLRKQLGVWYTPIEVVRYMVARVDRALKDDLGIAEGLAAENVYVLDPCCGTGAYLAEVLRRINHNLKGQGLGALTGSRVKRAATERVFGFEIMPAPFVVAHLQVGLTLRDLDAPVADSGTERAGIFLTNALSGWQSGLKRPLPFPELEEERDRAEQIKRKTPILVILGNPPYNGFAGMAVEEERALSNAYRTTKLVRRPEGQGLNDLYVRFFRMAERRIAEKSRRGVVCFISNYSWLDGLSFTGMRERVLEAFDVIRIDCLNGDKYKTGKIAPDGSPDPSIFTTEGNPVGIQVGTAIATLIRKADHASADGIEFRHLWGQTKRADLSVTAETKPDALYDRNKPILSLGLPFLQTTVSEDWFEWPALPDLFPKSFPGVKTSRDAFLVDVDLNRLQKRVSEYFDANLSDEEIERRYPGIMKRTARFDARAVRDALLTRGGPDEAGFVRFAYRPFDIRWLYWEKDTKLLDEKRAKYRPHVFGGNLWLSAAKHLRKGGEEPQACFTTHIASLHLIERGALMFPVWRLGAANAVRQPNLSEKAQSYLARAGWSPEDLFHFVLAVLHDPGYRSANAGALKMSWPRIPLPGWPDGETEDAAQALTPLVARGRDLAAMLDTETSVPGVTGVPVRSDIAAIAKPTTRDGRNMTQGDFVLAAGWGHFGSGNSVMPGQGRAVERPCTPEERAALGDTRSTLGGVTFDIHLNDNAFWRNVPATVWNYKLGGYQVLKKWLSYREHAILGRPLSPSEVEYFSHTARRIAAILVMTSSSNFETA